MFGLECPPQPSNLEKHTAMLNHQHMHTSEKSWKADRIFREIMAQMAGAFSQPGPLVRLLEMSDRNRTCQSGRVTPHPDV